MFHFPLFLCVTKSASIKGGLAVWRFGGLAIEKLKRLYSNASNLEPKSLSLYLSFVPKERKQDSDLNIG
jgi:hypothetical protein